MLKDYKGISGIYQIKNTMNGKCYIGSCSCYYTRKSAHISLLENNKHHSIKLQRAWNKYGKQSFEFSLLITVPKKKEYLIQIEQWYIDNTESSYNICKIAGSTHGRVFTEEHKLKLSIANTGKKRTREQKLHQKLVKTGKTHTENTIELCRDISNRLKGTRKRDSINKEQILSTILTINREYKEKTLKCICKNNSVSYRAMLKVINNTTWKELFHLLLPEAISNLKNPSLTKLKLAHGM